MIVAMETHLLSNIALPLLLLTATHHSISAVTVRTVEADQWHCGETLVLAQEVDTYRVVVPKPSASSQNCPISNTSFDCSIHFKLHQPASSSSTWRHNQRQICVDYARVRLKGDSTNLTISRQNQQSVREQIQELTSSKFSQLKKYMATVKCTSSRETVTLTFQSACKYSLRHYFISWIYVYHQPSKHDLIYHIDGTCRHKDPAILSSYQKVTLTVRSYIWHDTAQEPDIQNCNLKVSSYASFSLNIDSVKLCPQWDFQHFSCQVTAHLQEAVYMADRDCSDGKNATCHTRRWHTLNSCVPLHVLKNPLFCVRRDQRIPDEEPVPDGAMFFQMNAELQIVKKKYGTVYNPGYTDDDNSYHTEGDTYHTDGDSYTEKGNDFSGIIKVIVPVIVLFSICLCLGCIARKKVKRTPQPQYGVNPPDAYTHPAVPVPDYMRSSRATESVAMEPLVASYRISLPADRPHSTDLSRTRQISDGRSWVGPGGVGVAAPPPSYNDIATVTPSAPTGSHGSGQPTTGSGPLTPPPPISAIPPLAPPAYHELFPSNT